MATIRNYEMYTDEGNERLTEIVDAMTARLGSDPTKNAAAIREAFEGYFKAAVEFPEVHDTAVREVVQLEVIDIAARFGVAEETVDDLYHEAEATHSIRRVRRG